MHFIRLGWPATRRMGRLSLPLRRTEVAVSFEYPGLQLALEGQLDESAAD